MQRGLCGALRPGSQQEEGPPFRGRPFNRQTAVENQPRYAFLLGVGLRNGEDPVRGIRQSRIKTFRHWITSFQLFT